MTTKQFLKRIGDNVAAIREAKGISQMALARKLETGNNQVRRIEKGLTSPSIVTLRSIAKHLDVPLSEIIPLE